MCQELYLIKCKTIQKNVLRANILALPNFFPILKFLLIIAFINMVECEFCTYHVILEV
jgi:hypothetical protein